MVAVLFNRKTTADRNGRNFFMLFRIFTLRFNQLLQGFDDSEVVEFIKDKTVLSLRDYFFLRNEIPYLAIVLLYEPHGEDTGLTKTGGKKKARDESWRKLLTEKDMPLFDSLRSWRSERCKKEGVPPYVICNNKQLAKITVARPQSLSGLVKVEGFGQGKVEKYGSEMLEILRHSKEEEKNGQPAS